MTGKAGANTAAEAVAISSEEEGETPTKSGEETLSATNQEDTPEKAKVAPPTTTDQKEETPTISGEGPSDEPVEEAVINTQGPTSQEEPSASVEKNPIEDEKYLQERKRKWKAPVKPKEISKKPRTANTGIVIQEPEMRDPSRQREMSDDEYTSSEEPDSESDMSLEDEEFWEQQLPENHRELIHPPVERLEYQPWEVELDDDLMEDMKHYNTKKIQDSFDDKEDSSKQIKCGKVLHLPSLDELAAREPFLSYMRALGFD